MHMCMCCASGSASSEATMVVDALVNATCAPEARPGIPNEQGKGKIKRSLYHHTMHLVTDS